MKALFFDIDGTLIYNHQPVSKKTKEALQLLKENGHKIFLCTGRTLRTSSPYHALGFDGRIVSAGAYIEVEGQKIYETGMSEDEVIKIRSVFEKYHIDYSMETNDSEYKDYDMERKLIALTNPGYDQRQIESLLKEMIVQRNMKELHDYHGELIKTICFVGKSQDVLKAKSEIENDVDFIIYPAFSEDTINGELMKRNVDKGMGVLKVLEYYGMDIKDSIGFGDTMGDYRMIQTCALGVAMDNGDIRLKQKADAIAPSIENDGIYTFLKELQLI